MEKFQDFMVAKGLDRLAEKCVRERIPIVEFVQWYEEEGQFLTEEDAPLQYQPSFLGNVTKGALAGGGWGSLGGLGGTAIGAGIGALGGAGKYLWDKWTQKAQNSVEVSKNQAVEALRRLAKLTPNWETYIDKLIKQISDIGSHTDTTEKEQNLARANTTAKENNAFRKIGVNPAKARAAGITYQQFETEATQIYQRGVEWSDAIDMVKQKYNI